MRTRNKLYSILIGACLGGYIWLFYSIIGSITNNKTAEVCLLKKVTNLPCPSCGSTRSIILLTKGNFIEALYLNPLGYIIFLIMIIAPVWIILDLVLKNNSLFKFYQQLESYLQKPSYSIPMILLVIINWIWNISKAL